MFETLTLPVVNRLLRSNAWAMDTLKAHAGKTVLVIAPPARLAAMITIDGDLAAPMPEAAPDTTITLTAGVLVRMAARDESAWREAQVSGDVELAAAIDYVRRNLTWDYEETLAKLFGDVAAHRMASAAREVDAFARGSLLNLAHAAAEYATYENPVLASANELARFSRDVDTIRDDAARLEKRIALLTRKLDA